MMSVLTECAKICSEVRTVCPLVHNMTNYVTVNDVANAELAMGASPIMADDEKEAADITSISKALVINIGTLNSRTVKSMLISGKKANEVGIPVVLDPVGAGASQLRNTAVKDILDNVKVSVIRGNLSEISFIAGLSSNTKGVDSADEDLGNDKQAAAKVVAEKYGCVAAITGKVDYITDGKRCAEIHNGVEMLKSVTGTGCMTSGLCGGYIYGGDFFIGTVTAIAVMGIAGEISCEKHGADGTGSFHMGIIDAISKMDSKLFTERAKINEL